MNVKSSSNKQYHMKPKPIIAIVCICAIISGCSTQSQLSVTETPIPVTPTQTNVPVATPLTTDTTQTVQPPINCLRINQQPVGSKIHQYNQQRDGSLSADQLSQYLSMMRIESLCIPDQLGAPLLNTDWDSSQISGATGRMISLGFKGLQQHTGWGDGFILYATYNFSIGSEYETFAEQKDWQSVRQGLLSNILEIDGKDGFIRLNRSEHCMGKCSAYRSIVFPFEHYYIAVVYDLGAYDFDSDWDSILDNLKADQYPPEIATKINEIDFLASTLQFQD